MLARVIRTRDFDLGAIARFRPRYNKNIMKTRLFPHALARGSWWLATVLSGASHKVRPTVDTDTAPVERAGGGE